MNESNPGYNIGPLPSFSLIIPYNPSLSTPLFLLCRDGIEARRVSMNEEYNLDYKRMNLGYPVYTLSTSFTFIPPLIGG